MKASKLHLYTDDNKCPSCKEQLSDKGHCDTCNATFNVHKKDEYHEDGEQIMIHE